MFAEGSEVRGVNYIVIGVCTRATSHNIITITNIVIGMVMVIIPTITLIIFSSSTEVLLTSKRVTRAQPMSPSPYRLPATL